jgi:hypothetical protein
VGEKRNTYRQLVGKSDGKRPVGRPRLWWVDNIKMGLGEIGWDDMYCIDLVQVRNQQKALLKMLMNLHVR